MELFRAILIFGLVWGALLLGVDRAAKSVASPLSPPETALAYAQGCMLMDARVFSLLSPADGVGLRHRLEREYRLHSGRSMRVRPDFSRLKAVVMEMDSDRAEVLVFGEATVDFGNGSVIGEKGGMVVRLVRENNEWRVW